MFSKILSRVVNKYIGRFLSSRDKIEFSLLDGELSVERIEVNN